MKMKRIAILLLGIALYLAGCEKDGKNSPPSADAGDDALISIEQVFELDGSRSTDPDGDPLSYEWTLLSSPNGSAPVFADADKVRPVFIANETGDYWFQLRVFDGKNWSEPDSVKVTAEARGFVPVARIRAIPEDPRINEGFFVTGIESSDPNNDPLNFQWFKIAGFDDWGIPNGRFFYFYPEVTGERYFKIALKVDDSEFESDYAYQEIWVRNSPPSILAMNDAELQGSSPPYYIGLNASSNDPDGDPVALNWFIYRAVSGSNPQISDPTSPDPLFTTDKEGFYVLGVKGSDGKEESIVDYVTLCKGTNCPYNQGVSIDPRWVWIHPFFNATENKVVAEFSTSSLSYTIPNGTQTLRWVVLSCPTGVEMELLDPGSPLNTTMRFKGDLNMVGSACVLRLEADTNGYSGDFTFIKSSSDTNTDISVYITNSYPFIQWTNQNLTFKFTSGDVFQKIQIPMPDELSDPDGDSLNYYWTVWRKPKRAQVFFPTDSNRPDPLVYIGKGRDAIGDYELSVYVEDGLGGSNIEYLTLTIEE